MKLLLSLAVLGVTLRVLYSAPDGQAPGVTEDTLKREATQRNTHLSIVFSVEYLQVNDHCRQLAVQRLFFHIKQIQSPIGGFFQLLF